MSEWINIDELGTKGMEPDEMPVHRDPQSLDVAVNVRAQGKNLANAGGYRAVSGGEFPDDPNAPYPGDPTTCLVYCPDYYLQQSNGNSGTVYVDRGPGYKEDTQFLFANVTAVCGVNIGGNSNDWVYTQKSTERQGELQRVEVHVLNNAEQSIRVLEYNLNGSLNGTLLDYDASPIFSDGLEHWVSVEQTQSANRLELSIYIDDTVVTAKITSALLYLQFSPFTSIGWAGSLTSRIPLLIQTNQQNALSCIRSGDYNGPGGCGKLPRIDSIPWNVDDSNINIEIANNLTTAAPYAGTSSWRTCYADHASVGARRVYWEWISTTKPGQDNDVFVGACDRNQAAVGNGQIGNSVKGISIHDESILGLYVNGLVLEENIRATFYRFCFDGGTGEVWAGKADLDGGNAEWIGGADPEVSPGARNAFTDGPYADGAFDLRIAASLFDPWGVYQAASSLAACYLPPPSGFGYI